MNLDTFLKFLTLILLAPYWWPVLKALYEDFQGALAEEGGLFGRDPSAKELAQLQERYKDYESPLTSETHEDYRDRSRYRGPRESEPPTGQRGPGSRGPTPGTGRSASPGPRRRGF